MPFYRSTAQQITQCLLANPQKHALLPRFQKHLFCLLNRASIQGPSKAVELEVEKHCFCSSKALQLMVKSSAFAEAIALLLIRQKTTLKTPFLAHFTHPPPP